MFVFVFHGVLSSDTHVSLADVILPSVQSEAAYLDVVTLEQVQVRFALTRLLTHQSQDGVVAAGVHDGLTVLDGGDGEVLQLVLKEQNTLRNSMIHRSKVKGQHPVQLSPWCPGR